MDDYRQGARSKNNRAAATGPIGPTYKIKERRSAPCSYDSHLDSEVMWPGKTEQRSFKVDLLSSHVHEHICGEVSHLKPTRHKTGEKIRNPKVEIRSKFE